jgi:hypothetical protein
VPHFKGIGFCEYTADRTEAGPVFYSTKTLAVVKIYSLRAFIQLSCLLLFAHIGLCLLSVLGIRDNEGLLECGFGVVRVGTFYRLLPLAGRAFSEIKTGRLASREKSSS